LTIKKGERVLLAGQSGSGKSLLIRSIGGLWKHGDGDVILPADLSRMFVPQTAYIMGNMTLKENIIYPANDVTKYDDDAVTEALNQAELGYLVSHLNNNDRNGTSWRDLSPGEKQRLIFARIFLHKPDMVFLDEATSALDPQLQETMYQRLTEILPQATVVSIAHRQELMKYHTRRLDIKDGGLVDAEKRTVLAYCPHHHPRAPLLYLRHCA
jgi:putative ATP-binding cassette transporter